MKRQALSVCLAGSMMLGTVAPSAMALSVDKLTDVKKTDWFYPAVQYVAEKDYMVGVGEGLFAPTMEMSRAMFVTILYRLDGASNTGENKFVDVPADTWYTKAVNWAAENSIVAGIGGNKFAPEDPITREQMCVMMNQFLAYRAKKDNKTFKTTVAEKAFADAASISAFAKEAVKKCQMWGLVSGNEKGYFNPLNNSTRAEVASVVQRLDTLLASGQSNSTGGGGGGGIAPSTNTANYTIKATLDVPDSVSTTDPDLMVTYNNVTVSGSTVTGDKTFGQVTKDLVGGENATALKNAVSEVLNRAKGKTITQTVNGQQVTVSVSESGVISAYMAVKATDMTGGAQTFALRTVTQEQLEALVGKLQNGGSMSFTKDEVLAMGDLLTKVEEVQNMDPQEIQDKIDQVVAEKPELEQVVSGMTPEAVKQAAEDYKVQVEDILTDLGVDKDNITEDSIPDDIETVVVEKDPVVMNVQMDLGTYYGQAVEKFNSSKTAALDRLEDELYPDDSKTINRELAGAVYDLNNPANYVSNNGDKTLTLKDADTYFNLFQNNVNSSIAFYESLGENAAFYQDLLERVENKYQDGYGVSYTGSVEDVAALLGDSDGILVDGTTFREDMTFSVTVTADETTYSSWLDLITGKFSQAGSILPGEMPAALANLVGDYTITLNIDKQ